ncbi:MAG: TlpA family protein disulfide reductase [Lysobacterales bacterium]|nr:MAG: TlpA family protein disulfide reductase [Xanthomonadales bacterium]
MNARAKRLAVGLACALLLFAPLGLADDAGDAPVDFTLQQLGGGEVSLSDYRGEWVVVNYWATWCAPCRKEMPELSELHEERGDVTVLGLAYEEVEDNDFEAFLKTAPVSYPILKVDVYAPPQPFGAPKVLPTTIILDHEGRAVKTFLGPVTRESIERYIDARTGANERR